MNIKKKLMGHPIVVGQVEEGLSEARKGTNTKDIDLSGNFESRSFFFSLYLTPHPKCYKRPLARHDPPLHF